MNATKIPTILLVDDDDDLRDSIAFDLKRKGYRVLEASDGAKALAIAEKEDIDLVISDIRMPGVDGVKLLEMLRARHPDIPVVVLMTGFSDYSEKECIAKGAKRVITKPFNRKDFLDGIASTLPPPPPKKSAA